MNISSISIQTHREVCSPKTSGDVWHSRHPPETSEGGCRLLTGLILIEIHCLTPRASSAKRSRERVLSRLSLDQHDFCWSRHRAGAPHTHSYSTFFPGQNDESTKRRPEDGPRPSPGLREVAAHRCDKKGSRRYICAKRDPECKKGATSPSSNRTHVKSATRKSIGRLDLQSFHEIQAAVFRKPLLCLLRRCCDPSFGYCMHNRLCPVLTIEFGQNMGHMQFDRAQTDPQCPGDLVVRLSSSK